MLEVSALDECARRDAAKERRRQAEQVRARLMGDGELLLNARADAIQVAETSVYLRKCEFHLRNPSFLFVSSPTACRDIACNRVYPLGSSQPYDKGPGPLSAPIRRTAMHHEGQAPASN